MMNEVLQDLINEGHVLVYLDDILVFTEDLELHRKIVHRVLQRLREHQLYLKPSKCFFEVNTVSYLGLIIGNGTVATDPKKIEAIVKWAIPTNRTEVQSFIGFINFYRRFIANFSHIAKPLHRLTGNQDFEWGTKQQQAFDALKEKLCSEPVLRIPTDDGPFRVETDCSQFAMGGVLSQYIDGKWHPIAYWSEALTAAERNYEIHDREMLAIMKALEDWRQYLLGAKHRVEVWTDHLNLTFFRSPQKLNR